MTQVQKIATLRRFMDIATAGRHRVFSTIYIKHNLFHKSKLGNNVELQNTHILLFKSPHDVHQVGNLSVQLGPASALVDWYRYATSVPFGHLLIDLSPRTDATAQIAEIFHHFYVPDNLKHSKYLDDEHTKSLYSPSIPTLFPRMQNSASKNLSKKIYPISQRVNCQPTAGKIVRSKKKSRPKKQRRNSRTVFKKNNLEPIKKSTFVAKKIIAHENNFLLRHYLEMEQFVLVPVCLQQHQEPNHCHKTRNNQIHTWSNSHVPQRYVKKGNYPTA